ncbi:hypothetical protein MMC12_006800 [Toensbergia leucococca]|nr:hypothetical protein [Toensbergia leucococca]
MDDDTTVHLFHQASFLRLHQEGKSNLFAAELIDETLRTLALLLPSTDANSKKWYKQKQRKLKLDSAAAACGHLEASKRQIEHFKYWRDRLVILKQTFDESDPHTISQWWYDNRKRVQWWTFWVAALVLLLTIIFGLIQSATGIIQAWIALRVVDS